MSKFFKWIGIIFLVFMVIGVIAAMFGDDNQAASAVADTGTEIATGVETETESPWSYSESTDEMRDSKIFYAETVSTNSVDFEFPYNGGSSFSLTLRKRTDSPTELLLIVSKGQFMPSIGNQSVNFRFDGGEVESYVYSMASDGSADAIFIDKAESLAEKLKRAKKVKVEAEFFDAGRKVINFDVSGLEWTH